MGKPGDINAEFFRRKPCRRIEDAASVRSRWKFKQAKRQAAGLFGGHTEEDVFEKGE